MLGPASSKWGAMSSLIRWKRLICPHGVLHVPKSAFSASTASASEPSRSAGAAREVAMYCMIEIPAARASRETRRPARSPPKIAIAVGTGFDVARKALTLRARTFSCCRPGPVVRIVDPAARGVHDVGRFVERQHTAVVGSRVAAVDRTGPVEGGIAPGNVVRVKVGGVA